MQPTEPNTVFVANTSMSGNAITPDGKLDPRVLITYDFSDGTYLADSVEFPEIWDFGYSYTNAYTKVSEFVDLVYERRANRLMRIHDKMLTKTYNILVNIIDWIEERLSVRYNGDSFTNFID